MSQRVAIIGAGAAGLVAAIAAARSGATVTLLDRNERPGRKLLATGNGKCNLSNTDQDLRHFHGDREKIQSILSQFSLEDVLAFFSDLGLDTRVRNGWIYPLSDQAGSLLDLLLLEIDRLGVRCKYNEPILSLEREGQIYRLVSASWTYEADRVIIACGSPASAVRGACADARSFAESLQIPSVEFLPALVPLRGRGSFLSAWAGVRSSGSVALFIDGELQAEECGELQFTEFGISGIPVLQLSRLVPPALQDGKEVTVRIDLLPERTLSSLAARLSEIRRFSPEKTMEQAFAGLIPGKLIPVFLSFGSLSAGRSAQYPEAALTCREAADRIKSFSLPISGTAPLTAAQVCSGGIRLSHLTTSLESQDVPGIFFAGECIDVTGDCGGYNLQWAWSSGTVAGKAAAKESSL